MHILLIGYKKIHLIIFGILIGSLYVFSLPPRDKLDLSNPVDRFFYDNPEYLPDSVVIYADLPKIKLNNGIVDTIVI